MRPLRFVYTRHIASRFLGRLCASIVACLSSCFCTAPTKAEVICDSTLIRFHQSQSQLDPDLGNNRANLSRMLGRLHDYAADSVYTLSNIHVIGTASPEGSIQFNRTLSEQRAHQIFNYFFTHTPHSDATTDFTFIARDWQGLYTLVEADPEIPYRTEILNLLTEALPPDNTLIPAASDHLLQRLKVLHGGTPYRYMYEHLFPALRISRLYVRYNKIPNPYTPPLTLSTIPDLPSSLTISTLPTPPTTPPTPFYFSLSTNLLYDLAALPTVSIEFYLGRNWTIGADWTYGWWDDNRLHRYWRAYGGNLLLRRWFGRKATEKPLTGHHLGLLGGVLTYDFEWGGRGYMGGLPNHTLWDRFLTVAGIEYGYSLPIARRLNLDFSLAIGYVGGKYIKYVPHGDTYLWQSTNRLNWVGPVKAGITLVWLLGRSNRNP